MGGKTSKDGEYERENSQEDKEVKPVNHLRELQDRAAGPLEDITPNQALLHAAENGDIEGIRLQLKNGADVNYADAGPIVPEGKNADDPIYKNAIVTGDYPLHKAAQAGKVEAIDVLFLADAGVDNRDRIGSTAVHRAVSNGHIAVVRKLLSREIDADIGARNHIGNTPLHVAAYTGNLDIARVLLDHGAYRLRDEPNKIGFTPVDYARKTAMQDLLNKYRPGGGAGGSTENKTPKPSGGETKASSSAAGDRTALDSGRTNGKAAATEATGSGALIMNVQTAIGKLRLSEAV